MNTLSSVVFYDITNASGNFIKWSIWRHRESQSTTLLNKAFHGLFLTLSHVIITEADTVPSEGFVTDKMKASEKRRQMKRHVTEQRQSPSLTSHTSSGPFHPHFPEDNTDTGPLSVNYHYYKMLWHNVVTPRLFCCLFGEPVPVHARTPHRLNST